MSTEIVYFDTAKGLNQAPENSNQGMPSVGAPVALEPCNGRENNDTALESFEYDASAPSSKVEYEAYGPSSVASSCKSGTSNASSQASGEYVERKDENGAVMRDAKGNIIKWKVRRRAGHRGRARRTVRLTAENGEFVENPTTYNEDVEDDDVYDDRIGDAEDRVMDIQHLIATGEDVDFTDTGYVTNFVTVKPHKSIVQKYFSCLVRKKKKKKIGY